MKIDISIERPLSDEEKKIVIGIVDNFDDSDNRDNDEVQIGFF